MSVFSNNLLLGAGGQSTGQAPFDPTLIGNSVWLDGSADYLSKTPSAGTTTRWIVSFWVQRNTVNTGAAQTIFSAGTATGNLTWIRFDAADNLDFAVYQSSVTARKTSSAKYRDIGWYHICVSFDSGSGIAANSRIQLFVNGLEVSELSASTATPSGETTAFNANLLHEIGRYSFNGGEDSNVYLTQFTMLENKSFQNGDLSITDLLDTFTFGTNGSQYAPKSDADIAALATTAGGNSFCLDFANSSDLGNDISSNNNDFTPTSMSSTNQSTNTPSLVYPKISNLGIPSGDAAASYTMGLGSNRMVYSGGNQVAKGLISTTIIQPDDPKIYWEYYVETGSVAGNGGRLGNGIAIPQFNVGNGNGFYGAGGESAFFYRGTMYDNGAESVSGFTIAQAGDIQQMAFEPSTGKVWIGVEGTWRNGAGTSGTTLDESNPDDQLTVQDYIFIMGASRTSDIGVMNFGDNPTMSGNIPAGGNADENGYGNFKYAVPSGFLAPNSANLTAPDYQGIDYFKPVLYTGNGTAIGSGGKAVTGVGWQPDEVWIKNRDATDDHALYDIVRGVTKQLESNTLTAESTESEGLTTFGSDGFTVGSLAQVNTNTEDYVSWNWLGSNSTSTTSPAGSIASTSTAADAGNFSVGTYTGQTAAGTVGHGLGGVAEMVIVWDKGFANSIAVYHAGVASDAATDYLLLNSTDAATDDATFWNDTAPTSSVFSVGTGNNTNGNTRPKSFLAFRSVAGVCKVGSYIGNSSATAGPYLSLGFKPAWWMVKCSSFSDASHDWFVADSARYTFNGTTTAGGLNGGTLEANDSTAEKAHSTNFGQNPAFDFLADGIKLRSNSGSINATGRTYIYLAMADIGGNGTLPPVYGR